MTNLRGQMLADLRARGVLITRRAEREALVDAMLAGGSTLDGADVRVIAADWREVVAWLDDLRRDNPGLLAADLVAAMRDPAVWQDLVLGAMDWRRTRPGGSVGSTGRGDPTYAILAPPTAFCLDECGGRVLEATRTDAVRGRWVCATCGLEWVRVERKPEPPIAGYRSAAPRWLGLSPDELWPTLQSAPAEAP